MLFAEYALPVRPDVIATTGWIVGGPLLNDGVVAPLTAVLGFVLSRIVPHPWKTPVVAGTVITGVLAIVAFPLLWRPYGTPPMPGLHDGDPALGLALTVAAVWLVVVATALVIRARRPARPATSTATPATHGDPPPASPATSPGRPPEVPRAAEHPTTPGTPASPTASPGRPPEAPRAAEHPTTPGTPASPAVPPEKATNPPSTPAGPSEHPGASASTSAAPADPPG
ncbi:hypothetical protein MUY14_42210 [Amycolatopsis sp. FBCC-B4732]|uniref:hypothetical protein n=1 Tax=Amycolatopsis sp. FBCC-B4732 TaxID=3079339 RepID=UPI001FF13654|nr:hypothetical protein [Amycolatopsis sp. FBCC-B4732]UOX88239.1 hypothetical protein MUY14_42210 [Amycolatopsis sp. FBCC-B4732]